MKNAEAWVVGFALAGISAALATYVYRNVLTDPASIEAAAIAGLLSGAILTAPMAALLMKLWDLSQGIAGIVAICLQHDAYVPKAIEYLDQGIRLYPNDAELYNLRAVAWSRAGNETGAGADWRKVFELQPERVDAYLTRGQELLRQGRLDQAVEALRTAIQLKPKNARAHRSLGLALERLGELNRAFEHYDRAIALAPKRAHAYADRARAHFLAGRHQRSVDDCDQATELDETLIAAYLVRAHALSALGQHDRAAHDYQQVWDNESDTEMEEAAKGLEAIGRTPD